MRRIVLLLVASLLMACEPEQPPAVPPPPSPPTVTPIASAAPVVDPAPIVDGDVTQAWANGAMILVKRVPGAEMVAAQLYLKGGVIDWTEADAGVGELALHTAAEGGTTALDKDAFARRLASLGSSVSGSAGNDYVVFNSKGLLAQFDATTNLMFDAFLTPALPAEELEIQRSQLLQRLAHEQEEPDALLGLAMHRVLFKGHPYANRPVGTAQSMSKLTLDQVKGYLGKIRETTRALLVVVGDVDPAHVVDLAKQRLAALPRGDFKDVRLPPIAFNQSSLSVTEAQLPTNYIESAFVAPNWRDDDFYAAMVASEHLQFRLFEEVRTKRNLSYAPASGFRWNTSMPFAYLYVTAVDPKTTMEVMYAEAKKMRDVPLDDKALLAAKSTVLTGHLMGIDHTDGLAGDLASAQIHGGDFRLARTLVDRVKAVTAAQVQDYARRYMLHMQTVVVGDSKKIDQGLFTSM